MYPQWHPAHHDLENSGQVLPFGIPSVFSILTSIKVLLLKIKMYLLISCQVIQTQTF